MGASAEVDRYDTESLIHRHHEIAGSQNASFAAQRLRECFAQGNASVFHRMVLIDIKIAICL